MVYTAMVKRYELSCGKFESRPSHHACVCLAKLVWDFFHTDTASTTPWRFIRSTREIYLLQASRPLLVLLFRYCFVGHLKRM